ncbi:MAG: hypothetical protein ACLPYS_13450 [Vulcanimicrobiaceae bacterium]
MNGVAVGLGAADGAADGAALGAGLAAGAGLGAGVVCAEAALNPSATSVHAKTLVITMERMEGSSYFQHRSHISPSPAIKVRGKRTSRTCNAHAHCASVRKKTGAYTNHVDEV